MKLRGFDITKAQLGWVCDCCFTVTTARQFTDEGHAVRGRSKWIWLAMWRSYRLAKKFAKSVQAKPGEREANGWAA